MGSTQRELATDSVRLSKEGKQEQTVFRPEWSCAGEYGWQLGAETPSAKVPPQVAERQTPWHSSRSPDSAGCAPLQILWLETTSGPLPSICLAFLGPSSKCGGATKIEQTILLKKKNPCTLNQNFGGVPAAAHHLSQLLSEAAKLATHHHGPQGKKHYPRISEEATDPQRG